MAPKRKGSPTSNPSISKIPKISKVSPSPSSPPASSSTDNKPIFFFRSTPSHPYAFLSQWYPLPFRVSDHPTHPKTVFANAEQYMMFEKALLFNDQVVAEKILGNGDPKRVKKLGRQVKGFEEGKWRSARVGIVENGSWWKFACEGDGVGDKGGENEGGKEEGKEGFGKEVGEERKRVRDVLLATGERELVEASPFDRIWGIGYGEKDAESHRDKWGANLLGKCLMNARERMRGNGEKSGGDVDEGRR